MSISSYTVNGRELTASLPLEHELLFAVGKNYLFELSYLALLAVLGEKAAEFLQGQLSCDLRQVNARTMRQAAICNLKGRVLALMDVIDWQGLKLVLPQDLIAATEVSLSKTALLSRVKLEASEAYSIYGFYLANPDDLLPADYPLPVEDRELKAGTEGCCYRLSKQLYLILIKKEEALGLKQPFSDKQQLRGSLAWHYLQLAAKTIEIYPQTRGLFLPHRLGLHLFGYLSFDKGCYKGQEIIARTHYRAKLKHHLVLFRVETHEPIHAGQRLFASSLGAEVGELIDYCPLSTHHYLLALSLLLDAPEEVLIEGHSKAILLKLDFSHF